MKTIKVKSKLIHHLSDDVVGAQTGLRYLSTVLKEAEEALLEEIHKEYPKYRDTTASYNHNKNELTVKSD